MLCCEVGAPDASDAVGGEREKVACTCSEHNKIAVFAHKVLARASQTRNLPLVRPADQEGEPSHHLVSGASRNQQAGPRHQPRVRR